MSSSTEYADWLERSTWTIFNDVQLDAHFPRRLYRHYRAGPQNYINLPASSLLSPSAEDIADDEPSDAVLMAKAEGISGGVRYSPDGSG